MSTITKRLSVDQYDQMVENGILPETNRLELIEGRIVEKDVKNPAHSTATERTRRAIGRILPGGWYVRQEQPVRIPNRKSEPEPDVSVVRGAIEDYATRHPNPEDVALVVEVTRSSVAKDRALARVYGGGGIPAYWIVNVPRRRLEVYEGPVPQQGRVGRYPAPKILGVTESVDLTIDGQVVGQIAVAELLPRSEGGGK
jgi:Uma2 family endonuclease